MGKVRLNLLRPCGRMRDTTEHQYDYNQGEGSHGFHLYEPLSFEANTGVHSAESLVLFRFGTGRLVSRGIKWGGLCYAARKLQLVVNKVKGRGQECPRHT